jgi:uncharacterized protein YukE
MGMIGADLEAMAGLASTFERDAQAVVELQARVGATLAGTAWTGRVADQFRDRWASQFVPALRQLEEALTTNARVVRDTQSGFNLVGNG